MFQRTLVPFLSRIIQEYGKMAFLSGPRQVGKTTLSRQYQKRFDQSLYFNWDIITDQKKLTLNPYFFAQENRRPDKPFLVIFDEIHKYAPWKNYLKGAYDRFQEEFRFLVTGSGRLELFKKGGDSLLGRYLSLPLYPLSLGELQGVPPSWSDFKKKLLDIAPKTREAGEFYETLFKLSGFPEPLERASSEFYNQWFNERKSLLLREDIRNAANIREISLLEVLSHLIPERVGNPLSINSLREDVGVAFETIRDWVLLLERFFYLFRITPFAGTMSRSLRKESKVYLYDWVEVLQESYRFENLVALHLRKAVDLWRATGQGRPELHYLRDKNKREVDFVITENNKPLCLVECKFSEEQRSGTLSYYQKKLGVPVAVQLLHKTGVCKKLKEGSLYTWIISADHWLGILP